MQDRLALVEGCLDLLQKVLRQHDPCERVQRRRIVGTLDDAERSDDVADDLVFDERLAASQPARDVSAEQLAFEISSDAVFAVENGGVRLVAEIGNEPFRLVVLIAERLHLYVIRRLDIRGELLVEEPRIVCQDAPRRLELIVKRAVAGARFGRPQRVDQPSPRGGVRRLRDLRLARGEELLLL